MVIPILELKSQIQKNVNRLEQDINVLQPNLEPQNFIHVKIGNNFMPAKTEKQRKFFGAVMGAKKAAKEMSIKQIKDFLKKENVTFSDFFLLR
jgi:hypothetical protein